MKIADLLKNIEFTLLQDGLSSGTPNGTQDGDSIGETGTGENWLEREVTSLIYDSRKVVPGSCFACEDGTVFDGIDFLESAREKGAVLAVMDKQPKVFPAGLSMILVPEVLDAESKIAYNFYGAGMKDLPLIGMTGTNGKTTTSTLMHYIFSRAGRPCGLIGTNENRIGERVEKATHTTPYPFDLYPLLTGMVQEGVSQTVMEVSSHALAQHRVSGLHYQLGMFTNLTEDHLDYHKTMEAYLEAKCILFYQSDRGLINGDDPASEVILATGACPFTTYGLGEKNDYRAENMVMDETGLRYEWTLRGTRLATIEYPVPGRFNVYNTLLAASACHMMGLAAEEIAASLHLERGLVAGRFETFRSEDGVTAVVDYAHTPDGLENVLNTAGEFVRGRIITVFGCGGDRDPKKRPIMGEIAGRLSDYAIITSDNPRTEDPEAILDQVEAGLKPTGCAYERETDRRTAIAKAVAMAQPGDLVMVAGKGHEDYQILGRTKIHLDDREEVRKALQARTAAEV